MISFFITMDLKNGYRRNFKILRAIFFLQAATRNEIARFTSRSSASVTEPLNQLLRKGLVERSGKVQKGNGRPSAIYRLGEQAGHSVGISFDATKFHLVEVDAQHRVLRELERNLSLSADPSSHLNDILAQISTELRGFLASAELRGQRTLAIGIAPPGMVDTEKGIWLHGLQVSGITHVALGDMIEKMFGVTVLVEDVARCLAYLQASSRPVEKAGDLVYLYLGTGVGPESCSGKNPIMAIMEWQAK